MHAKLEDELRKFFRSCKIEKIHLLTGKSFCFIQLEDTESTSEAIKIIKSQSFNGKVLKLDEKANINSHVPGLQPAPQSSREPKKATAENERTYELEVLDLASNTRQNDLMKLAYQHGAVEARVAPPIGKLWVLENMREEVFININNHSLNGRIIKARYPPFTGKRPTTYKPTDTCRIIVEGIVDPERDEVQELIKNRFLAFGHVSGVEVLRNRTPSCAFIDIERNMASIACETVDNEIFFGEKITVALMKQDEVIVIDSEEEDDPMMSGDIRGMVNGQPPLPPIKKRPTPIPADNILPSIPTPSLNSSAAIVDLMCERERLEVLHPYEEYLIQVAPSEGSIGLDDSEPLPNPPQQFIRLLMDRALVRTKLMKLANKNC